MSIKKAVASWRDYFEDSGLRPEIISKYIEYLIPLLEKDLPIIFDFPHLCLLLGKNRHYLASVINSTSSHYRSFEIPKRSGGMRSITAPYPTLMECQNWIYNNILIKSTVHSSAHGFTFKKSIITNAKIHIGQTCFLKVDIKDFFPSITINQIISVFKDLGYSHKVSFYLASICCYEDSLPQGAPTSPVLSNIVSYTLDRRLMSFAKMFNLKYTRYADDLAFSGDWIPVKFIEYISEIIKSCGFEVNNKKTVLQQKKAQRILTGISIADSEIKIPREFKRNLKQEVHYIRTFGIFSHIRKQKIRDPEYLLTIIGRIRFWLSVEPSNEYAKRALVEILANESLKMNI